MSMPELMTDDDVVCGVPKSNVVKLYEIYE